MNENLRDAWTSKVLADDYETHMAAIGQAQANAALVSDYLRDAQLNRDASVLFAGAGTGQMFDFLPPSLFLPFQITFADINAGYLQRLSARLIDVPGLRFEALLDDVENTALQRSYDAVIAVLVLEHVDWKKAVASLCKLAANKIFVVVQENPPEPTASLTSSGQVPGTMNIFKTVHPALIPRLELETEFAQRGFFLSYSAHKIVAQNKKMLALRFLRA